MTLVLVPTSREAERLQAVWQAAGGLPSGAHVALCGFGMVAAAARTAHLVETQRPTSVLLVGIAGAYSSGPPIGAALSFGSVVCHGIGAGEGASFLSAAQIGWPQWAGDSTDDLPEIGDRISLDSSSNSVETSELLSVCAASGSVEEAERRCQRHPLAVAEDMEGFAVALACQLASVPLRIVRGISNQAGQRDIGQWRINDALVAAGDLALRMLRESLSP